MKMQFGFETIPENIKLCDLLAEIKLRVEYCAPFEFEAEAKNQVISCIGVIFPNVGDLNQIEQGWRGG